MVDWRSTIKRLRALNRVLGVPARKALTFDYSPSVRSTKWVTNGSPASFDGASLSINSKTGLCTVTAWMESHHNGDHYGIESFKLSREESHRAMLSVMGGLERKAITRLMAEDEKKRALALERKARVRLEQLLGPV